MKSNPKINDIELNTHFSVHRSPLWHQQSTRFAMGVVEECTRELRLNGYDDAANLLEKYFDSWIDV